MNEIEIIESRIQYGYFYIHAVLDDNLNVRAYRLGYKSDYQRAFSDIRDVNNHKERIYRVLKGRSSVLSKLVRAIHSSIELRYCTEENYGTGYSDTFSTELLLDVLLCIEENIAGHDISVVTDEMIG